MAHLPLLFSESSHLLLSFFLLVWTSRWFCVHLCSGCSGGNTDIRTGWSEEQQGNVCLRLWLTLMDRVSSNTLTPFSHEALPHFSSPERPSEFLTGAFFVCSHLYFYTNWFLIFFISDFVPWGLFWHMWAKGAQPILSKVFFFSRYRVCVSDNHIQCELYFKWPWCGLFDDGSNYKDLTNQHTWSHPVNPFLSNSIVSNTVSHSLSSF